MEQNINESSIAYEQNRMGAKTLLGSYLMRILRTDVIQSIFEKSALYFDDQDTISPSSEDQDHLFINGHEFRYCRCRDNLLVKQILIDQPELELISRRLPGFFILERDQSTESIIDPSKIMLCLHGSKNRHLMRSTNKPFFTALLGNEEGQQFYDGNIALVEWMKETEDIELFTANILDFCLENGYQALDIIGGSLGGYYSLELMKSIEDMNSNIIKVNKVMLQYSFTKFDEIRVGPLVAQSGTRYSLYLLFLEKLMEMTNNKGSFSQRRETAGEILKLFSIDPFEKDGLHNRGAALRMFLTRRKQFIKGDLPDVPVLYIATDAYDHYVDQGKAIKTLRQNFSNLRIVNLKGDVSRLGHGIEQSDQENLKSYVVEFFNL